MNKRVHDSSISLNLIVFKIYHYERNLNHSPTKIIVYNSREKKGSYTIVRYHTIHFRKIDQTIIHRKRTLHKLIVSIVLLLYVGTNQNREGL
jgi:hypothetical protein